MSSKSLCSANLFLARATAQETAEVTKILGRFRFADKTMKQNPNPRFDLEGFSYQEVKDGLVIPLAPFLDPDKRSSVFYRGADGRLHTIMVLGGEVVCS